MGWRKPGNKKNADIQMIASTGNVQKRINSPSARLIVSDPLQGDFGLPGEPEP
jgi:hypothetical protein